MLLVKRLPWRLSVTVSSVACNKHFFLAAVCTLSAFVDTAGALPKQSPQLGSGLLPSPSPGGLPPARHRLCEWQVEKVTSLHALFLALGWEYEHLVDVLAELSLISLFSVLLGNK